MIYFVRQYQGYTSERVEMFYIYISTEFTFSNKKINIEQYFIYNDYIVIWNTILYFVTNKRCNVIKFTEAIIVLLVLVFLLILHLFQKHINIHYKITYVKIQKWKKPPFGVNLNIYFLM